METNEGKYEEKKKKYVVVGGGWAGWGAAKTLCESGPDVDVILVDAIPDPTGVRFLFVQWLVWFDVPFSLYS